MQIEKFPLTSLNYRLLLSWFRNCHRLLFLMICSTIWSSSCIFFLLSREKTPGVLICWTMNHHPLRRFPVPRFRFLLEILSTLICCLFGFHQAEISMVNRLIQGRHNMTRVRVEPETLRSCVWHNVKTAPWTILPRSFLLQMLRDATFFHLLALHWLSTVKCLRRINKNEN